VTYRDCLFRRRQQLAQIDTTKTSNNRRLSTKTTDATTPRNTQQTQKDWVLPQELNQ
jgi:hypothetical protein